jgi:hypothetical protein
MDTRGKPAYDEFLLSADQATPSAVIPREGGVSSTPQPLGSIIGALEYWIIRLRG